MATLPSDASLGHPTATDRLSTTGSGSPAPRRRSPRTVKRRPLAATHLERSLAGIAKSRPFLWGETPYIAIATRRCRRAVHLLQEVEEGDNIDHALIRWATVEMIAAGIESGAIRLASDVDVPGSPS